MPIGSADKGLVAIGLTLCLPLFFAMAWAQDTDLPAPNAIGRISYGGAVAKPGDAICTGTLVAADLVLTADHCLRGSIDSPASVYFSAGLHDGKAVAVARGQEIILTDPTAEKLEWAKDVALLRLNTAIDSAIIKPLAIANPSDNSATLIAYARRAPDIQTRNDDCFVVSQNAQVIGLSCPVVSGNSGAPVLMRDGETLQVVAVVIASAKGISAALAVHVPPELNALIAPAE